ncbi:MAG: glycerophosphodiester phosphodiesterase family protein [Cyclobacteriaceae bacterium]
MKWHHLLFIGIILFASCRQSQPSDELHKKIGLDIQGHRGARGLMPENTLPAFKKALDLKVNTLELDLSVTKDGQLVVSHEPWISPEICLSQEGEEISEHQNRQFNIFQMTYEEVRSYDCGSKQHERFPEQERHASYKPLLVDMVKESEAYGEEIGYQDFNYNIEIKSRPQGDTIFHPVPAEFSDLVYSTIGSLLSWDRVTIQSFDFRVLRYFNENYPEVQLVALVENQDSWEVNIEKLGFTPKIYSPYYKSLRKEDLEAIQAAGMEVVPWTVNTAEEMTQLIEWGVDGIITDYPNIAVNLNAQR